MRVKGSGWELLIERRREDQRGKRRRTVGKYQVYHAGKPVDGLSGACAETRGPGDNSKGGNNRRIEAGTYPLRTQAGTKYVTIGYTGNKNSAAIPRPGLELGKTNKRSEILLHPGRGFLSSIGCINPAKALAESQANIDFLDSRTRTIAIIDDLRAFLGGSFPQKNGQAIATAFVVIEGEP
jgi:hypothetical protein